jgi:hypothetical protein
MELNSELVIFLFVLSCDSSRSGFSGIVMMASCLKLSCDRHNNAGKRIPAKLPYDQNESILRPELLFLQYRIPMTQCATTAITKTYSTVRTWYTTCTSRTRYSTRSAYGTTKDTVGSKSIGLDLFACKASTIR